jgi:hypothetical protein
MLLGGDLLSFDDLSQNCVVKLSGGETHVPHLVGVGYKGASAFRIDNFVVKISCGREGRAMAKRLLNR